jgi:hypothetical protein
LTMKNITSKIVMIRPANFGYNAETAVNNAFQNQPNVNSNSQISKNALQEFDEMVDILESYDIKVTIIKDKTDVPKPDAIFPNNWFSTHAEILITYPLFAPSRRTERSDDIISTIKKAGNYTKHIRFEQYEDNEQPLFLEGTGSLVLDRKEKVAYAAISPRTSEELVVNWCELMGYKPIIFKALGPNDEAIYHTNVMMCIGEEFAVVCVDCIEEKYRKAVIEQINQSGKLLIAISKDQAFKHFAGNMIQLISTGNDKLLILSQSAYDSLSEMQRKMLLQYNRHLIPIFIPTIEKYGGGSVRCMIAELF